MCSHEPFVLTLWTADPALAKTAEASGVDRIGVDLEYLGKDERQRGRGTWISPHAEADLDALRPLLSKAQLFARVNPLNPDSAREVEAVLARGAQVLMLPMVMTADEAAPFVRMVRSRATVVLLVEHVRALDHLPDMVRLSGVDEVHIGLNDLAISLGLRNRWMALDGDLLVTAGRIVRDAGKRFGLGGIGRAGDTNLPVPSDLIYAEYARTGANAALLSRSFFNDGMDLAAEVWRARDALHAWKHRAPEDVDAAHAELGRRAAQAHGW
jgi:2-keto-3-deoxy-L-rhamnonate aldolase RhmA